jgi:hypothetical protein
MGRADLRQQLEDDPHTAFYFACGNNDDQGKGQLGVFLAMVVEGVRSFRLALHAHKHKLSPFIDQSLKEPAACFTGQKTATPSSL